MKRKTIILRHVVLCSAFVLFFCCSYAQQALDVFKHVNGKYGFKNKSGTIIVAAKYEDTGNFFEGVALVKQNNKWGFIDETGREIITPKYDDIGYELGEEKLFIRGRVPVRLGSNWGMIDKKGIVVVPVKYQIVHPFVEGMAAVLLNDRWGFVDTTGKEVVPVKYSLPDLDSEDFGSFDYVFRDGMAAVLLNGKYGFIDKNGKEVIAPQYRRVEYFKNGFARVMLNKKDGWFLIDKTGNPVNNGTIKNINEPKKNTTTETDNLIKNSTKTNDSLSKNTSPIALKGKIDSSLAGTWKYYNATMDLTTYYVFREDGTFDYYPGYIGANNSMANKNCTWRVDGEFLETACEGYKNAERYSFRKQNDPATGKPALMIEFKGAIKALRMYIAMEQKPGWK